MIDFLASIPWEVWAGSLLLSATFFLRFFMCVRGWDDEIHEMTNRRFPEKGQGK